ncbi:MAG: phage holin family protein [Caulobacterales bacterium]
MVHFILRALVTALGLWVASKIVPGVHVRDVETLIIAGFLLGIANAIVRPILTILTLPLTIVTLGLFLFVVNGLMVLLVSWLLHGFVVHGLWRAILVTVIVWAVSLVGSWFIGPPEPRRR